jgi:chromate reductase
MTKITIIVGSLRRESINKKLAEALTKLAKPGTQFTFARIDDVPLFNQDLEANVPAPVTRLKKEIEDADALLVVTPEYNRGIPGPLKNAIDWASRPYGKSSFFGKPAAIIGASGGAVGTAAAQQQLRALMVNQDTALMGLPEAYIQFTPGLVDDAGNITKDDTRKFLQGFMDKFAAWIDRVGKK